MPRKAVAHITKSNEKHCLSFRSTRSQCLILKRKVSGTCNMLCVQEWNQAKGQVAEAANSEFVREEWLIRLSSWERGLSWQQIISFISAWPAIWKIEDGGMVRSAYALCLISLSILLETWKSATAITSCIFTRCVVPVTDETDICNPSRSKSTAPFPSLWFQLRYIYGWRLHANAFYHEWVSESVSIYRVRCYARYYTLLFLSWPFQ